MAEVPLSQLAFGLAGKSVLGSLTITAGDRTWQDDTAVSAGFKIFDGRCLVILSVAITIGLDASTEGVRDYYGYSISGPSDISASTTRAVQSYEEFGAKTQLLSAFVHTGLAAGDYTITGAAMRTNNNESDSENTPMSVSQRTIVVLPY